MAEINVIRNTYGGMEYLRNALEYVSDERSLCRGGYGVDPYDTDRAYEQMIATRRYFGKVSGNPLVHVVIAYDKSVTDLSTAVQNGFLCARYFAYKYQVLYCTHEKDTSCGSFHTHLIINAVSYVNGQMISTGFKEMNDFCSYVTEITGQKSWFYFDNKAGS